MQKNNGIDITLPYPPAWNPSPRARKLKLAYCERCRKLLSGIIPDGRRLYMAVKFFPFNQTSRGDLDNLIKTLLDALKGSAFFDDSQVCAMYLLMMESDKFNPRVELRISAQRPIKNNMKGFCK